MVGMVSFVSLQWQLFPNLKNDVRQRPPDTNIFSFRTTLRLEFDEYIFNDTLCVFLL